MGKKILPPAQIPGNPTKTAPAKGFALFEKIKTS